MLGVGDPARHSLLLQHEAPVDAFTDVLGQDPNVVLGSGAQPSLQQPQQVKVFVRLQREKKWRGSYNVSVFGS